MITLEPRCVRSNDTASAEKENLTISLIDYIVLFLHRRPRGRSRHRPRRGQGGGGGGVIPRTGALERIRRVVDDARLMLEQRIGRKQYL